MNDDQPSLFGNFDDYGLQSERPACLLCGAKMKRIMYGFPSGPPPEDADYVLGGCMIFAGMPQFTCPPCDKKFEEIVSGIELD